MSSACAPTQIGGMRAGGNQTTAGGNETTTQSGATSTGTTNATGGSTAGGGATGNQSTSSPIQLIEHVWHCRQKKQTTAK